MKHQEFDNSYPLDGVSLYWVAAALLNQNFDLMDVIVPQMNSEAAAQALETLKSVDLSKVDDLVILYDLQDYRDDRTVYDEANDKNLTTVYGALTATIKLFQEQCPHIRIYLLSQPYGTFTDANGKTIDIDRDDLGNGTMVDYLNWEVEACRKNGVSFIDNYYGAITMEDTDCLTDGYHLNQKGREKSQSGLEKCLNSKWILQTNREPVHTAQAPGLLFFSYSFLFAISTASFRYSSYASISAIFVNPFFADRRYTEHSCSKSDTGSCTPSKAAKAHPDQSYPPA